MPKVPTETPSKAPVATPGLHWKDRPQGLKDEIKKAFEMVKKRTDGWMYDGTQEQYDLLKIDQYKLFKSSILENYPDQKMFTLLDIGAGEFAVIQYIAKGLNEDEDIPKDINVRLIGIRGEELLPIHDDLNKLISSPKKLDNRKEEGIFSFFRKMKLTHHGDGQAEKDIEKNNHILTSQEGVSTLYRIGAFQIENMIADFKRLSEQGHPFADLEKGVDLIISSFTFIHLVDALGTFLQAYSLLRPKTGMILSDGFRMGIPKEDKPKYPGSALNPKLHEEDFDYDVWSNIHLYWMLYVSQNPFLLNGESHVGSLNEFLMQRPDEAELELPLKYEGVKYHPYYCSRLPQVMSSFIKTDDKALKIDNVYKRLLMDVTGDKSLYDSLKKDNKVFVDHKYYRKPSYISAPLTFSIKEKGKARDASKTLSLTQLKRHLDWMHKEESDVFLEAERHASPFIQHEYDKHFGLVLKR